MARSSVNAVIWCLTDGKPGHENQTRGLVAALQQQCSLDAHFIPADPTWRGGWDWLRGRFSPGDSLPSPHLIVAAGHSTHPAALAGCDAIFSRRSIVRIYPNSAPAQRNCANSFGQTYKLRV